MIPSYIMPKSFLVKNKRICTFHTEEMEPTSSSAFHVVMPRNTGKYIPKMIFKQIFLFNAFIFTEKWENIFKYLYLISSPTSVCQKNYINL